MDYNPYTLLVHVSGSGRRWFLVCLLSLGVIIAYVDRTNLSVSLASADFKALFHLTDRDRTVHGRTKKWTRRGRAARRVVASEVRLANHVCDSWCRRSAVADPVADGRAQ